MVPIASHTHPANLCICIVQVKHLVYMDTAYKTHDHINEKCNDSCGITVNAHVPDTLRCLCCKCKL